MHDEHVWMENNLNKAATGFGGKNRGSDFTLREDNKHIDVYYVYNCTKCSEQIPSEQKLEAFRFTLKTKN